MSKDIKEGLFIAVTATLCVAFLLWGTIYVWRTVENRNYHAPTQVEAYNACMMAYHADSGDCKTMTQPKK